MKKTMLYILTFTVMLALASPLVVNAAPWGGRGGPGSPAAPAATAYAPAALTPQQIDELRPLYQQMVDVQKQILQKYVDFGYITQAAADQRAAWLQQMMDYRLQNGYGPGFGMMMGGGPGMMGGWGRGYDPGVNCPYYNSNTANTTPSQN